MRKLSIFISIAAVFGILMATQAYGEEIYKKIPYENPWVNNCTDEIVDFTGTMQFWFDTKLNKNRWQFILHSNLMGVSGVGRTSGEKYQIIETSQGNSKVSTTNGLPVIITSIHNLQVIGPGSGNHYTLYERRHFIVNNNGDVIIDYDNFGSEGDCK